MELACIANKFYKARNEIKYNNKKVYFILYCCKYYPDYCMKESYKFDTLYYYNSDYESIKLFYKNKLVAELTKWNCIWISAIYLEDKYISFKLIDYSYKDLEVLEIIKKHKLLNYVIKNPKCAKMYHLTEDEIEKLKEFMEVKA